ncbi:unnamed protein product [Dovyalis caffra]|uniref:Uncharacterized protein n=1 Tax=Dovyalis caffra TaxID=77055 RepID=A0AAV1RRM2_9ROSI|nr:unnamed protein product [Dovyalis caffra]
MLDLGVGSMPGPGQAGIAAGPSCNLVAFAVQTAKLRGESAISATSGFIPECPAQYNFKRTIESEQIEDFSALML